MHLIVYPLNCCRNVVVGDQPDLTAIVRLSLLYFSEESVDTTNSITWLQTVGLMTHFVTV